MELKDIKNFVQSISEAISEITDCHITISDNYGIRIAGTGLFKDIIGQNIPGHSAFYKAMISKATVIVKEPGKNKICYLCDSKGNCKEKFEICTPIIFEDQSVGVIGIIATSVDQEKFLENKENAFIKYIEKMAELISTYLGEHKLKKKIEIQNQELTALINNTKNAVICISNKGEIKQINDKAVRMLGLKTKPINCNIKEIWPKSILEKAIVNPNNIINELEVFINSNGEKSEILSHIIKIYDEGKLISLVGTFEDPISVQKTAAKIGQSDSQTTFNSLIGNSKAYIDIKNKAMISSKYDSNVLITGESGTGKELFARAIHEDSYRRNQPFVSINCSAIPETLLESELFGYEGGAFTGANVNGKIGKMELANNGTFFLDEIGDMTLYLQSKMLRVLQERKITRVGGNKPIDLNLKIISATNKNLEEMVKKGEFRDDLYFRLNVVPLEIPPLRERVGDIQLLAEYFLNLNNKRFNKKIKGFTKDGIELLESYTWPGNIRELENVIEFISNFISEGYITSENLKTRIQVNKSPKQSLNEMVKDYEESLIKGLLDKYGNDEAGKKVVADQLKISRATLYRKLSQ